LGVLAAKTQYNLKNAKKYFEDHLCVGDYYTEGQQAMEEWFAGIAGDLPNVGTVDFGVLPQWQRLRQVPLAQALLAGTNAAVVGLLAAAFYSPICTSALTEPKCLVIAFVAFVGLMFCKLPPWMIVLGCALAGKLFLH
jgi:chromate transport protein ChrA